MYSLITFATQWGSKHGGINSFNTDFLKAFGIAFHNDVQVICIVTDATTDEIAAAKNSYVILVKLPYPPKEKTFSKEQAQAALEQLNLLHIEFEPEHTVWLGHDRITGTAAIEAAKISGGRSALLHHMSYNHYESFAENSQTANHKYQEQLQLFKQADLVLAIGPLLRDAAQDMVKQSQNVHMLVPGLAEEIEVRSTPKIFTAFLSGRLSKDAARIKQGHLGIAAFSHAHKMACEIKMPDGLCKQPKLMLRGVDFESEVAANLEANPETELKVFAEKYAERAVNLQALPYTHNREELYDNISRASVVLMPSWHEGFGLTAWEAIAAGVPLIVSQQSGVYSLLEEEFPGAGTGCVYPVDVRGSNSEPFFRQEDLVAVAEALKDIAHRPEKARQKAGILRSLLFDKYSWPSCAEHAAKTFSWKLKKGCLPSADQMPITPTPVIPTTPPNHNGLYVSMPRKRWQLGRGVADSQLLRAEEALVPFDPARQPELDKLNTWLDDDQYPQAVRLLTGAGGLGKTRLALHLCQQRITSGWYAGFMDSELADKELASGWEALKAFNQPLLIVIDYAETRQDSMLALLGAILKSPADKPVRLLLLARDGGEWWNNLPSKNKICESLLSGYATSGPYRLPPLHDELQNRQQAYRQALNAFAEALGVLAPDVIPELAGEHFGRPLYLQMAALLALHGERPTTEQGLTRALLIHERRYWHRLFSSHDFPEPDRYAEQLLALTTLAGGFSTPKAALHLWEQVNGKALSPAQFNQLFHALTPLYPGKQGLQPVRPDLLGEALVAQALLRPSASELLDAVLGKDASQSVRLHALTVISRLSDHYRELHEVLTDALARHFVHCLQEFIRVATETHSELPALAEAAFARLPANLKSQAEGLLSQLVKKETVQLSGLYCMVIAFQVEKSSQKCQKKHFDINSMSDLAGLLIDFSISLYRSGRNEEVLNHAKRALEILQQLTGKNPDRFEPGLAASLSNYATHLDEAGRNEEALDHAKRALEIRQRLAEIIPDRFEPDLAISLGNYANFLSQAGHNEEALDHAKHALEIRQRLAEKNPDRFEPDFATSLGNYALHLDDAGRNEEALDHAKRALEFLRRLAEKNPDRFEPDFATSLSNYAKHLDVTGRNKEALDHAKRALKIRQRLAEKNPDRFDPDLATSLSNYASHLDDAGRNEEALDHAKRALKINQRLAEKNPDRFDPDFAMSLSNYANHLNEAGRNEEALDHAKRALNIRHRLAKKNPGRFEPDLAMSLDNYANHLDDAGRNEEALDHAKRALEIYQRLVEKNPGRFEPDLATSLSNHASHLDNAGRNEEALDHAKRALDINQRLADKSPDSFEPDLAMMLGNYANYLDDAGRNEEALDHAKRTLVIRQRLAEKNPARFAESKFSDLCYLYFSEWLAGKIGDDHNLSELNSIPETTPQHRRPLVQLFASFIQACCTQDQSTRSDAFKRVTSHWDDPTCTDRTTYQVYWLCTIAWCARFEPTVVANVDWQTEWNHYAKQRQGNVPCWMRKVAQRLEFKYPLE